MDHKHFQSAKRPFSVTFNSKPTNQVIRYEHKGQVSAKIMSEQKADFLKFDSNLSKLVFNNNCNSMYFSGSEFPNKLLAMSGIFKTKNWFRKEDKHIGSNRKQIFFGAKAKFFSMQSNVSSTSRSIFGNPLTCQSLEFCFNKRCHHLKI